MIEFSDVVARIGGRSKVAKLLGVTPQAVFKWEHTKVPAARAIQIEQLTHGFCTVKDLRPDLFEIEAA